MPPRSLALAAILILAAAVRFWGISFGLPHTQTRPDETTIIDVARKFLQGDMHPQFFDYPWLYMWISTALYLIYYAVGHVMGWFSSVADLLRSWPLHWEPFFIINRSISATLGTLTVAVIYGIGRRLWNVQTGLVAAFFLALAFLHTRDSHFGTTDVTMTFFVMLSTLWLVDGHLTGRRRSFVWAGLAGGLATATKYSAGLVMFPIMISQVLQILDARRTGAAPKFDGRVFWFGVPCFFAFLTGVPFLIFDYTNFRAGIGLLQSALSHGTATGDITAMLGNGWLRHLQVTLFYGVGWPMLVVALAAAAVLLVRRTGVALMLLVFPIGFFYVIGGVRDLFVRYGVPLVPFLCLLAAWAVVEAARVITRTRGEAIATCALAIVIVAPSAMSVLRFDRIAAQTDNRVVVARWFDENVPAGASVAQSGSSYGYAQFTPGRFNPWLWDGGSRRFVTVDPRTRERRPAAGDPDYILVQESPLPGVTQDQIKAYLAQGYAFQRRFQALTLDRPRVYDVQDAFYIPFADFSGVERPGPNFMLYKHVQ